MANFIVQEWLSGEGICVKDLIQNLNDIIEANPSIDFNKVGVSLNSEYTTKRVKLNFWTVSPDLMRCELEID